MPVYSSLSSIRSTIKSEAPESFTNTGKIYIWGSYIFLNEVNKGIHVIDNSKPTQPRNIAFINIPGNVDLAVKDNYLYADAYSDLVVFDISNPAAAVKTKFVNNVFPDRAIYSASQSINPDSIQVITGYTERDTVVDCSTYQRWNNCANCMYADASGAQYSTSAPKNNGAGGSMARFAINGNYMYTVSERDLSSFSLQQPQEPTLSNTQNVGWGIETIFPFSNKLFIGSTSGMFIYNIDVPAQPQKQGQFSHVRSCDPVIADNNFAFVTLRSGTMCQGFTNQLEVLDINDVTKPLLLKTYPLTNPHGLAKDGNLLFICDGKDGLKVFNAEDVNNLKLLQTISGIETYDVIAYNNIAIVVAKDGLYQYSYDDVNNIRQLSKLSLSN